MLWKGCTCLLLAMAPVFFLPTSRELLPFLRVNGTNAFAIAVCAAVPLSFLQRF